MTKFLVTALLLVITTQHHGDLPKKVYEQLLEMHRRERAAALEALMAQQAQAAADQRLRAADQKMREVNPGLHEVEALRKQQEETYQALTTQLLATRERCAHAQQTINVDLNAQKEILKTNAEKDRAFYLGTWNPYQYRTSKNLQEMERISELMEEQIATTKALRETAQNEQRNHSQAYNAVKEKKATLSAIAKAMKSVSNVYLRSQFSEENPVDRDTIKFLKKKIAKFIALLYQADPILPPLALEEGRQKRIAASIATSPHYALVTRLVDMLWMKTVRLHHQGYDFVWNGALVDQEVRRLINSKDYTTNLLQENTVWLESICAPLARHVSAASACLEEIKHATEFSFKALDRYTSAVQERAQWVEEKMQEWQEWEEKNEAAMREEENMMREESKALPQRTDVRASEHVVCMNNASRARRPMNGKKSLVSSFLARWKQSFPSVKRAVQSLPGKAVLASSTILAAWLMGKVFNFSIFPQVCTAPLSQIYTSTLPQILDFCALQSKG